MKDAPEAIAITLIILGVFAFLLLLPTALNGTLFG